MVRITIVAVRIYGEPDADLSVVMPLEGEISKEIQKAYPRLRQVFLDPINHWDSY